MYFYDSDDSDDLFGGEYSDWSKAIDCALQKGLLKTRMTGHRFRSDKRNITHYRTSTDSEWIEVPGEMSVESFSYDYQDDTLELANIIFNMIKQDYPNATMTPDGYLELNQPHLDKPEDANSESDDDSDIDCDSVDEKFYTGRSTRNLDMYD